MNDPAELSYRFGPFLLVVHERSVSRNGEVILLNPKEFDVLVVLVRNAGHLVTKQRILEAVWPDTHVSESSLSKNISILRREIGEEFIQTVPKSGYRFSVAVECLAGKAPPAFSAVAVPSPLGSATGVPTKLAAASSGKRSPQEAPNNSVWRSRESATKGFTIGLVVIILVAGMAFGLLRWKHLSLGKLFSRLLILPVLNSSADPEREYLADGLTEELISGVRTLDPLHLGVIASTTANLFKGSLMPPVELGRSLSVDYVLVTSLLHSEKKIKVSMHLVRVRDDTEIWSAEYDRDDQNILGIVNEAALSVAKCLRLRSTPFALAHLNDGTKDSEAYEDYLKGRFFWNKRVESDVLTAISYFSKAIGRDALYARAYAGLADSYIVLAGTHMQAKEAFDRARDAAEKALFLDQTLAEAHDSLAYIMYAAFWDWKGAEREYKTALELDPGYAVGRHWYFIFLTSMKRYPEAIAESKKALEADPLSQSINYNAGMTYALAEDYDRARLQLQKAIELDPQNPVAYGYLGQLDEFQGLNDQAAQEFIKARNFEPEKHPYDFELADAYARGGKIVDASKIVQQLKLESKTRYENPYWFVVMYSGFRDADNVLRWLGEAVRSHSCTALEVNTDPRLDFVRSDPRFKELAALMHLPE